MNPVDAKLEEAVKREMNRFRGKMAGFIESYGFPEKQERGLVSHMKNLSYETEAAIKKSLHGE